MCSLIPQLPSELGYTADNCNGNKYWTTAEENDCCKNLCAVLVTNINDYISSFFLVYLHKKRDELVNGLSVHPFQIHRSLQQGGKVTLLISELTKMAA